VSKFGVLFLCLFLSVGLVNTVCADVIMQCDVGGCGPQQSGWTQIAGCGTTFNVGGTGIDVTLATGEPGACECRNPGGTGLLADVEADLLFANDVTSTPDGDFIITFSNLTPGASYRLLSFHNRSDEGLSHIEGVVVTGATNVTKPDRITQDHTIMDNPAEILFTAGAGDVSIRYIAPTQAEADKGAQAFLNGFILEYSSATIGFASTSSGGVETLSPALITVNLTNPEAGQTYTVDYAVVGGTADGNGVDYTLEPNTLVFNPGETSKTISIDIYEDAVQEGDETIILQLSNPAGPSVTLATAQHTYTISDGLPGVAFGSESSSGREDVSPVLIPVTLSYASDQVITVDYGARGGSATGGSVDYNCPDGTLRFEPGQTTQNIAIDVLDDSLKEDAETISLSLFNPTNATLGTKIHYTYTILDNEEGLLWDGLRWYYSDKPNKLFVNADGNLEWDPEKGEQFITRIPEKFLSQAGDVVEVSYYWMTDGAHDCPDCFACPDGCYDDSIECIAGTSDFRVGLFEADGEYVDADGLGTSNDIFVGYKGYEFRFGPNMRSGPTRWVDCTGEVHKTGQFAKKPADLSNLLSTNAGLMAAIPGFELPPGEYSLFTIRLERLSSSSVKLTITLNDRTYSYTDNSSTDQPHKIDVLAVHMRNGRPYNRLVLAPVFPRGPKGDFNNDCVVDACDLAILSDDWLEEGHYVPVGTKPDDRSMVFRYRFDETSGRAAMTAMTVLTLTAIPKLWFLLLRSAGLTLR